MNELEERALAGAARARQKGKLAASEREADVVERDARPGIDLGDVTEAEHTVSMS